MSSFRVSSSPRWCPTVMTNTLSPSPRACKFGSSCIKFGCPFKHPPSRPQDCPDGEFCTEAKCPLHHPRSRPITQHKYPLSRTPDRSSPVAFLKTGMVTESKRSSDPCPLTFSNIERNNIPRHPRVSRSRSLSRYSNRTIVRSPMVVPSPNNCPTNGYFADTTKPCVHGAGCVKFGCTYKHPPSRVVDCPQAEVCEDVNCTLLHPLNNWDETPASDAGFAVGQRVRAKFLPSSTKWSDATIHHIRGSAMTLQFDGFTDMVQIPLNRVRHHANQPNERLAIMCPSTPPPGIPPPPRSPSSQSDIGELQRLKQAAVSREDFLVAAQIKHRIETVTKIAELERRKQQAVCEEDFLLAMDLKKQIKEINDLEPAQPPPGFGPVDTNAYK